MNDNCIRKFFSWSKNSCYIDSLFVALFHSKNILIDNFVKNLTIRDHSFLALKNKKFNNDALLILYILNNIYRELQIKHDDDKLLLCSNIRQALQTHYDFFYTNNGVEKNIINNFTGKTEVVEKKNFKTAFLNPKELFEHLIDIVFNKPININFIDIVFIDDYYNLNKVIFSNIKDINFIDIEHVEKNITKIILQEKILDLYLHSIIIHTFNHYVCYYKCNNKWYYYNDRKKEGENIFIIKNYLIGTISEVSDHIYNNAVQQEYKLPDNRKQIFLLYLRTNPEQQALQQVQKVLQQVVEINNKPLQKEAHKEQQLEQQTLEAHKEQKAQKELKNPILSNSNNNITQLKEILNNHFDMLKQL